MAKNISVTIKFWKQNGPKEKGHFDTHELKNIPDDTSFLEALDIMNEELIGEGKEPFVFDHDCREGICGMCSLYINGTPHGKTERGATTCQLYMRKFKDGETITVEPWRSAGFPVIKDCMVDRNAFDKIMQAGGYTTVRTGQAQDANAILIPKDDADEAMDCASCIGCGACVAACKNGSAMLFVSSKVSQLALLPQGKAEAAHPKMSSWNCQTKEDLINAIMWERVFEMHGEVHEIFDTHRRGGKFMSEWLCKPINEWLKMPEQVYDNKGKVAYTYFSRSFQGHYLPEDPEKLRKSVLFAFPEHEFRNNAGIDFEDQNDFYWSSLEN